MTIKQLDHISDKFLLLVEKRRALKDLEAEVKRLDRDIRAEVGDAEEATIFNEVVIRNDPVNKFKAKEFEKDNPTLFKEFTRPVVVYDFDVPAFQAAHPNLYVQYQSRQFRILEK